MIRFCKNLNASRQLLFCLAAAFALTLFCGTASALQSNSSDTIASQTKPKIEQGNKTDTKAAVKKLPESRIAELRAFAKQHHPEIMPLLNFLAEKRPKKFDKVMIGFDRDVSNLEKAKQKSPEAYERGLAAWVNQSRIKLYAAQFKVAADEETAAKLQEKIKQLIAEKVDARIEYLEREQATALAKVKRLEKSIEAQKTAREATIQKRMTAATKNAPNMSKKKKVPSDKEKSGKNDKEDKAEGTAPSQKPAN